MIYGFCNFWRLLCHSPIKLLPRNQNTWSCAWKSEQTFLQFVSLSGAVDMLQMFVMSLRHHLEILRGGFSFGILFLLRLQYLLHRCFVQLLSSLIRKQGHSVDVIKISLTSRLLCPSCAPSPRLVSFCSWESCYWELFEVRFQDARRWNVSCFYNERHRSPYVNKLFYGQWC